LNPSIT